MSDQAKQDQSAPHAPTGQACAADLSELLGYINTAWDDQRRMLSRQLHDSMGSSLTALTMHLSLLIKHLPPDKAVQDRAANMKQLLMNVIENNRQMQVKLWNDKLEFLGVTVALKELASQVGEENGLTGRCSRPEDELACPRAAGVVLLRTAEEGLRNVLAHAKASEVDIVLDDNEDEVMLTVKDNGTGPVAAASASSPEANAPFATHGLRVLRERAAYLGGQLSLAAGHDGGAILTVILPKKPATTCNA
jgi:signal transduction histidine kinase